MKPKNKRTPEAQVRKEIKKYTRRELEEQFITYYNATWTWYESSQGWKKLYYSADERAASLGLFCLLIIVVVLLTAIIGGAIS